jgi:subtilisin family serine protease
VDQPPGSRPDSPQADVRQSAVRHEVRENFGALWGVYGNILAAVKHQPFCAQEVLVKPFARVVWVVFAAALFSCSTFLLQAQAPANSPKHKVVTASDLPRFSYPMSLPPSTLLMADDDTFNSFALKVMHDVDSVLSDYEIEDKATLRRLYGLKLNVQLLTNDNEGALASLDMVRSLQEKPQAKATSGMIDRPLVQARISTHSISGDAFERAFQANLQAALDAMEWRVVQDRVKQTKGSFEVATPDLILASEKEGLDPAASKSNTIDLEGAGTLIEDRSFVRVIYPVRQQALTALTAFVAAHNVHKPDIWAAREVILTAQEKLTPVRIGIWDSGVDTALYPHLLFSDPSPDGHSQHGLAYDMDGKLYNGDLQPLTPEQKQAYPKVVELEQGLSDIYSNMDSPAATEAKKTLASMPPDQLAHFMKQANFLGQWMHGTHVAGIATRGNPAARIVVAQFYDSLAEIPFAPTVEWANKFKAAFQQIGDYFRANDVRVVNMSWGDDVGEIEQWLSKTSAEKDPAVRKQVATEIYKVWREAIETAIRSAPHTLFVCAAGNSNSDAGFLGDVPASLHLPNLIAVGAVDQAGEETSFTSYGDTVQVDADGFQVESYVPGGTRIKMSGTSMASPNVANLAAKLIALDPSLTPEETIALIKQGGNKSADGRRNLIDPKATIALLKERKIAKSSK